MKKIKYSVILFFMLVLMFGCFKKDQETKLKITSKPKTISVNTPFSVKGDIEVDSLNSDIKNLKIILSLYNNISDELLMRQEKTVINKTQSFEFSKITVDNISSQIYLEVWITDEKEILDRSHSIIGGGVWHNNIITTYFEIEDDETTAWVETKEEINPYYFALPYRPYYKKQVYKGFNDVKNRWIEIIYNGTKVYAQWEDVGPWNVYDPFYVFGTDENRPYAELGIDMGWSGEVETTNKAGLDVSKTIMDYLAGNSIYHGNIKTSWKFIDRQYIPNGPWLENETISISNTINLNTRSLRNIK